MTTETRYAVTFDHPSTSGRGYTQRTVHETEQDAITQLMELSWTNPDVNYDIITLEREV